MYTLNCKGKLLVIEKPLVMGILNATPDSFYDQYPEKSLAAILAVAAEMISEGANILDIGGQSTRPGSSTVSADEETARVLPVIHALLERYPDIILSVDTFYSQVAAAAVNAGAVIVNDISAGNMDAAMLSTVAGLQVPYICMHMRGTPQTMQQYTTYDDIVKEVLDFFIHKLEECTKAGIKDIIIDPGFGFAKTIQQNFTLLKHLDVFRMLDKPILAGLSRKSTVYKTLNTTAAEALNGTTVLNTLALENGAGILRVHDVKEAKEVCALVEKYKHA
ncbi:dihydropteroate synthase [Ferruginibacter paludis]|uniref:dihydropteroate synthase n=1 Tax=Ferruginibacter paludis TaxID=1310417 RepID=UPI0025B57DD0|nr:dihydropteroate synthase [Ferruginibacter paludis]MDN3657570.1 dihydropteroate synthase [Ferruginibacter paludis]